MTASSSKPAPKRTSLADRAYEELRAMAIGFRFRPGEDISETELAQRLGISRTPLREALNRLAREGLIASTPMRGFQGRPLEPQEIFELYEARLALEAGIIRLVVERATDAELDAMEAFLADSRAVSETAPLEHLLHLDEEFHTRLAGLSRNKEMARMLDNINARIRFIRWIDMRSGRRPRTQGEHGRLVDALRRRDAALCDELIRIHISRRLDEIIEAIRDGYACIYVDQAIGKG